MMKGMRHAPARVKKKGGAAGPMLDIVAIVDRRRKGRGWQYRVLLRGCKEPEETWLSKVHLAPWEDLLNTFVARADALATQTTRSETLEASRVSEAEGDTYVEEEGSEFARGIGYEFAGSEGFVDGEGEGADNEEEEESEYAEDEFDVEKIVACRRMGRGWQYRVRWVGYGEEEDTWLPYPQLSGCRDLVTHFKRELREKGGAAPGALI